MKEADLNGTTFINNSTERILAAAGVTTITAASLAVGYFNPTTAGIFPSCPFHTLTGMNCPGCGLTRGFHALFQGDVLGALHYNALLPIYAFVFGYLFISLILIVVRGRGLSWKVFPPSAMWVFFGLSLTFSIVRNLPFYPFNLLAI